MDTAFRDRRHAGALLARPLSTYSGRGALVLALPRGGVPVAYEVAVRIDAELDVLVVRKLGVPGRDELAMGALASGGIRVLDPQTVTGFRVSEAALDEVIARESAELARREIAFRGDRPAPVVAGRTVIVIDDGLATGATMAAAIQALRAQRPAELVVAVPVGAPDTCRALRHYVDEMICLVTPQRMRAVGMWYSDFSTPTDDDVRALLEHAARLRERRRYDPGAARPTHPS